MRTDHGINPGTSPNHWCAHGAPYPLGSVALSSYAGWVGTLTKDVKAIDLSMRLSL
ncbi:hypothetical protein NG726_16400 [Pseudomonas sp. MOB-449]|nr:hypothetical protein [Pseudomonas sp. MOB-449]